MTPINSVNSVIDKDWVLSCLSDPAHEYSAISISVDNVCCAFKLAK